MTDRINGFTVILEKDVRDDDFEATKNAVLMLKGVAKVVPNITTANDYIAIQQTKHDIYMQIHNFLQEFFD